MTTFQYGQDPDDEIAIWSGIQMTKFQLGQDPDDEIAIWPGSR
jgi:hypothetical protein